MTARLLRCTPVAAGLAALLAACGGSSSSAAPSTKSPATTTTARAAATTSQAQAQPASCQSGGLHDVEGGLLRMPTGAQAGRAPLLLMVIPGGQGDRTDRIGLGRRANAQGVAVLYPTSPGSTFWQLNDQFGTSDVTAVTGLIQRQLATGCFDQDRVSITGVSNGAGFTARMGCKLPTTFAAVMPVAAGYRALDPCPANARASFLDIHGTADTVVPINGKKPDRKGNVARFTNRVAARVGCGTTPRRTTPQRLVTHFVYRGSPSGIRVERSARTAPQRGWPGSRSGPGGRPASANPSGFSATTAVLRFIRTARRPGA